MALAIEIPAPRPGDSAQVVTSLENAALFGRIGDSEEALHWLQRAAESASETGDDERTLALARVAADLKSTLPPPGGSATTTPLPNGERRLPAPPPRSRPAPSSPVSAAPPVAPQVSASLEARREAATEAPREAATDEPTLLLTRPVVPLQSQAPGRPPPPSSRPQASRPPQQSVHALPAPAGPAVAHAPALNGAATSNGASSSVAPTSSSVAPTPSSVTPASSSVAPTLSAPWRPARVRQAARVSVEKSKTEPGLYLVRVLDEGRSADPGRSEALLVSLDPGVGLF